MSTTGTDVPGGASPFVKTAAPSTLMVMVDYDPGGDYDHHKTFLLLTFVDHLDKTTRKRVIARLRKTPQAYLPDTEDEGGAGDISNVATLRALLAACAEEGAPGVDRADGRWVPLPRHRQPRSVRYS